MRRPARIARSAPIHIRKADFRRNRGHREFIASLPCLVCWKTPSECAHVRSGTDGGTGLKPSDRFTLPLCHDCHGEQHQVGEITFWGELEIDPVDFANQLYRVSGDMTAGNRVILRAQQAINMKRRP